MFFNRIFNIHPTFDLIFHFISTNSTQPLQRHGWLTFMTRILKVKFYLEIVIKLFIFQNWIRFDSFFIESVFISLGANKTCVHCKSTNHLFVFRIDQSKLNISTQLNTLTSVFIHYVNLHHVVFPNFVLLQYRRSWFLLSFWVFVIRIIRPN